MTTIDLSNFTFATGELTTVNVAEFRSRISHLERLVNCDYHSCRGEAELARWRDRARSVGAELCASTCKRATADDWERRERAIERSTKRLSA